MVFGFLPSFHGPDSFSFLQIIQYGGFSFLQIIQYSKKLI